MKQYLRACIALCLLLATSASVAQGDQSAALEERLEQARARLQLSDEQVEQLAPVLHESMTAQQEILSKYGVDLQSGTRPEQRLGMRDARAMRKEMEAVRSNMMGAAQDILSPEQLDELEQMQEERRAEMRERMRGGR